MEIPVPADAFPLILVREHFGQYHGKRTSRIVRDFVDYDTPSLSDEQYFMEISPRAPLQTPKNRRWKINDTVNEWKSNADKLTVATIIDGVKHEVVVHYHNINHREYPEYSETDTLIRANDNSRIRLTNNRKEVAYSEQVLQDVIEIDVDESHQVSSESGELTTEVSEE